MRLIIYTIVLILISYKYAFVDATFCKPLSTFQIDCNICKCTSNGREYSCTEKLCPPREYDDFIKEETEDGHMILKPKPRRYDYDDYVLTKRLRRQHLPNIDNTISDNDFYATSPEELDEFGPKSLEEMRLQDISPEEDDIPNWNDLVID